MTDMSSPYTSFLRMLEQQRAAYRDSLPQRIAMIESLWQQVRAQPSHADTLCLLERAAHTLAGNGATFGFAALGDRARKLEDAVGLLLEADPAQGDTVRHALQEGARAMEGLRRAMASIDAGDDGDRT